MGRLSKTLDRLRVPKTLHLQRYVVFDNNRLLLLKVFLNLLAAVWYIAIFVENVDIRTDEIPVVTWLTVSLSTVATYAAFSDSFGLAGRSHTACNSTAEAEEFGRAWAVARTCAGRCSWQDLANDTCQGNVSAVDLVSSRSSTSSFLVLSRSEFNVSTSEIQRFLYPGAQDAVYDFAFAFYRMNSIHVRLAGAGLVKDRTEAGTIADSEVVVLGKDRKPWRTYESQLGVSLSALTIVTELVQRLPEPSEAEMPTDAFDKGMEVRSGASCWFSARDIRNHYELEWPAGSWSESASKDRPTCVLEFQLVGFDGVQWQNTDKPGGSRYQNRGLRITATESPSMDRIVAPSKIIMNAVLLFIVLIIPHYIVLVVARSMLGLLSRIYSRAIVENFDMVGRVSSLAFELMTSTVLFLKLVDRAGADLHTPSAEDPSVGDPLATGAISKARFKERLHKTLEHTELKKWQIDSFADFCFTEFGRVRRRAAYPMTLRTMSMQSGVSQVSSAASSDSLESESAESESDSQADSDELPRPRRSPPKGATVQSMLSSRTHTDRSMMSMRDVDDYNFDFVFRILFRRFAGGFEAVLALFAREARNPMERLFRPQGLAIQRAAVLAAQGVAAAAGTRTRAASDLDQDTISSHAQPHLGISAVHALAAEEAERMLNRKARRRVVKLKQKQEDMREELDGLHKDHEAVLLRMDKLRTLIHAANFAMESLVRDFENSHVTRASAKARLTSPRGGITDSTESAILEAQELVEVAEKEASEAKDKAAKAKLRTQETAAEIKRNLAHLRQRVDLAVARRQQVQAESSQDGESDGPPELTI